jgi:hypothetical protein
MSPVKDGPEHTDGTTSNEGGQYSDSEQAREEKDKNLKAYKANSQPFRIANKYWSMSRQNHVKTGTKDEDNDK